MTILRAFKRENIPAYFAVMGGTTLAGLASCAVGYGATPEGVRSAALPGLLVGGLLGAFGGMTVMFVASLLNLRKLRPGFERLARGETPDIPGVWCPVLTSAVEAAGKLSAAFHNYACIRPPPHPPRLCCAPCAVLNSTPQSRALPDRRIDALGAVSKTNMSP